MTDANPVLRRFLEDPIPLGALRAGDRVRSEVRRRARRLLDLVREADPEWSPPPFDPAHVASVLGIPITIAPTPPGCDALRVPLRRGGYRIVYEPWGRSAARRAFSLAHELMHLAFADVGEVLRRRTAAPRPVSEDDVLERLVDAAASELLMPEDFFRSAMAELGADATGLVELRERFAVSAEAAALRLLECDTTVCAVGLFHYARRPSAGPEDESDPRFEVPAYRARRVFRRRGEPLLFPPGKSVPAASAIARASVEGGPQEAVETFALGSTSCRRRVSAHPVNARSPEAGPPLVAAVFREP